MRKGAKSLVDSVLVGCGTRKPRARYFPLTNKIYDLAALRS